MPKSCRCILDRMVFKGAMTKAERDKIVRNLKTQNEERKTGKWKTNSDFPDRLICSECSAQFDMWHWEAEQMHYCPNCGARMEGAEE